MKELSHFNVQVVLLIFMQATLKLKKACLNVNKVGFILRDESFKMIYSTCFTDKSQICLDFVGKEIFLCQACHWRNLICS